MPFPPTGPLVKNAFVNSITAYTVNTGATIINSGASQLIERGSTLVTGNDKPQLNKMRWRDSAVALAQFTHVRTGLIPQTKYTFSMYAMNANPANSTGYAVGAFYTLANAPLLQPTMLNASVDTNTATVKWNNAKFPVAGARQAGYLLIYSTNNIVLRSDADGHAPQAVVQSGRIIPVASTVLPKLPPVSAKSGGFSNDSVYKFMLVPYTWNGSSDSTYNYLTQGALTTTGTMPVTAKNKTSQRRLETMLQVTQDVLLPVKDRAVITTDRYVKTFCKNVCQSGLTSKSKSE
jgi:hypothetical protein